MGKHSLYRSRVDCRMAFTNSGTHSTENKLLFLVYGAVVAKHIFLQKRIVNKSFFMNDKLILDNGKRKKDLAWIWIFKRVATFLLALKAPVSHFFSSFPLMHKRFYHTNDAN